MLPFGSADSLSQRLMRIPRREIVVFAGPQQRTRKWLLDDSFGDDDYDKLPDLANGNSKSDLPFYTLGDLVTYDDSSSDLILVDDQRLPVPDYLSSNADENDGISIE